MKKIKLENEFARNVLHLVRGTTIAQALPILISPLLTRLYSPEDFGMLAIYISLLSILGVLATGKYELAIVLPEKEEDSIQLVWLTSIISLFSSLLLFLILILMNDRVINHYNLSENYNILIYFLPASIFIYGNIQALNFYLNRNKLYKGMSLTKVINNFGAGVSQISVSGVMPNIGLVFGYLFGQISGLIYLTLFTKNRYNKVRSSIEKLSKPNFNDMCRVAKEYKVFPILNAPSSLLNSASVQLTPILISSIFSTTVTGFFSLAQRILQMPMSLLGSSISQVYFQKANQLKNNKTELRKLTVNINQKLLLIGIIPMVIMIVFGEYLFQVIFGSDWLVAGTYAKYLVPWIYVVFVSSPLSHLLTVLHKQKQLLFFNVLLFISRVGCILISAYIFQNASDVIIIYSMVGAITWFGYISYVMRLVDVGLVNTVKQFMPFAIIIISSYIITMNM